MKKLFLGLILLFPISSFAQLNCSGPIYNCVKGSATNDSAATGFIGEIVSSTIATGASVSTATGSATPITSISLTAGDWDVSGVVDYTLGATTSVTVLAQGSLALNGCMTNGVALGAQDTFSQFETAANVMTAAVDPSYVIPTVRVSIASTTTVCLIAKDVFTVSTVKAYGTLRARRVR